MNQPQRHLLVAEDTAVLALIIRRAFQAAGYKVTVAKNGAEAWQAAQNFEFDAVITDQQMPGMQGSELCELMRGQPCHAEIPIIMVTAKAYEMDFSQLTNSLRLTGVFVKPFSPTKLVQAMEAAMAIAATR